MCRDRSNGGRRCPHDNSEARRLRRVNAKKVEQYKDKTIEGITPDTTELDSTSNIDVIVTKAKVALSEYNDAKGKLGRAPTTPIWHSTQLSDDEIVAEKKLIELGDTVEELANKYNSFTDEDITAESEWIEENRLRLKQEEGILIAKFRNDTNITVDYKNGKYLFASRGWHNTIEDAVTNYNEWRETNINVDEAKAIFETYKADRATLYSEMDNHSAKVEKMVEDRMLAYRKALNDIGVEFAGTDDLVFTSNNDDDTTMISKASTYYPKDWVNNSNKLKKKMAVIEDSDCRANYDPKTGEINFSKIADDDSIITHELGHRMEYANPEIVEAERRFLNRRAGFVDYYNGNRPNVPRDEGIKGQYERGYPSAGFAKDYISKVYDFNKTNDTEAKRAKYIAKHGNLKGFGGYEIMTMGMESTFFGRHGANVGLSGMKADKEHGRFILGLIASSAK